MFNNFWRISPAPPKTWLGHTAILGYDLEACIADHEEEQTAPRVPLEKWTGIYMAQLAPGERLNGDQVHSLLGALKNLLDAAEARNGWKRILAGCAASRSKRSPNSDLRAKHTQL
jgi:hypothetical protein